MMIWQIETSSEYLSLVDANRADLRRRAAYRSGKLPERDPTYVKYMMWVSDETDERHERIPNFPGLSSDIACDTKAKLILEPLIQGHAEFLLLRSETITDKQYYLLWTATILGRQVTEENENVSTRDGIKLPFRHKSFILDPSYFDDVPIFRLPGVSEIDVFVTDKFKQLVEENNLTGLEFTKIWEV